MDVDFDLSISLKYVLNLGDVEMEIESTEEKGDVHRKSCAYCPKTFKTTITLERHTTKFHAGGS